MDTYTSVTYSIKKHNDNVVKTIEYNSSIKDKDKMINTYYNNNISNDSQFENFNKIFSDKNNTYEQIGNSQNKTDWSIQEYHNHTKQREYIDKYNNHKFNEYIMDTMPSLTNLLIDNK